MASEPAVPPAVAPEPGAPAVAPEPIRPTPEPICPTPDPTALPRSLGPPPLSASPGTAMGSLALTYEEAVRAATGLAAAAGILAGEPAGDT